MAVSGLEGYFASARKIFPSFLCRLCIGISRPGRRDVWPTQGGTLVILETIEDRSTAMCTCHEKNRGDSLSPESPFSNTVLAEPPSIDLLRSSLCDKPSTSHQSSRSLIISISAAYWSSNLSFVDGWPVPSTSMIFGANAVLAKIELSPINSSSSSPSGPSLAGAL